MSYLQKAIRLRKKAFFALRESVLNGETHSALRGTSAAAPLKPHIAVDGARQHVSVFEFGRAVGSEKLMAEGRHDDLLCPSHRRMSRADARDHPNRFRCAGQAWAVAEPNPQIVSGNV